MKKRNILLLIILSFFVFLPFNVKAQNKSVNINSNFSYVLRDSNLLTKSEIDYIDNLVISKTSQLNNKNVSYFVFYSPATDSYRVCITLSDKLYFMPQITTSGSLNFLLPYRYYFDVDLNTNISSGLSSQSKVLYQPISTISPGLYKNNKFYTYSEAIDEFGFSFNDYSTLNDVKIVMPIVYANSEFLLAVAPSKEIYDYDDLISYANWNFINQTYYDLPIFNSDSNFPNSVGSSINLTPAMESTDYTNDVTVSYVYDGKDNNTIEVNILIGDKPYSCFNGSMTFGDNVCLNRKNYDYLDFFISVNGNINTKIYASKDNENFVKSSTSFDKVDGGYQLTKSTLGTFTNKYKSYKIVITLSDDQVATFKIQYNSKYLTVNLPPQVLADKYYTEYDMTGKYAIGLIPKSTKLLSTVKYLGNFTTYYKLGSDVFAYKYDKFSSENYISKNIDFSPFSSQNNVIFYIMNNNYSDLESISKVKYLSNYFDLIYFEEATSLVTYDGFNYSAPDSNVVIKSHYSDFSSGSSNSDNSSNVNDYSLGNVFSKLPSMILGMGTAFGAIGTCIGIAFSSLPELVQTVLIFSLIITILFIAIKFIRG